MFPPGQALCSVRHRQQQQQTPTRSLTQQTRHLRHPLIPRQILSQISSECDFFKILYWKSSLFTDPIALIRERW